MKKADINHPNEKLYTKDESFFLNEINFLAKIYDQKKKHQGLNTDEEMFKCIVWELARTSLYENPSHLNLISSKRESIEFPFSAKEWPCSPYLSLRVERRKKLETKMPQTKWDHDNLFHNGLFLKREDQGIGHQYMVHDSEVSYYDCDNVSLGEHAFKDGVLPQISTSVPMILNIGSDWKKTNFKNAIDRQWDEIQKKRDQLKRIYESKGASFSVPKMRADEVFIPILRQLGHYRLICHCGVKWNPKLIKHYMGNFAYSSEAKFIQAVKKSKTEHYFQRLKLSKEKNQLSSFVSILCGS